MNRYRYLWQTLRFYGKAHLGMMLAVAVSAAVVSGALLTGNAMRFSLAKIQQERLGLWRVSVERGGSLFPADLSGRLRRELGGQVCGVLALDAALDGALFVARAELWGVDSLFLQRSSSHSRATEVAEPIPPGEAWVSPALAERAGLQEGDEIVLRVPRLDESLVATPLGPSRRWVPLRLRVSRIRPQAEVTRRITQRRSLSLLVDRAWLANRLNVADRINLLFTDTDQRANVLDALSAAYALTDAGLRLAPVRPAGEGTPDAVGELTGEQLFLPEHVERAGRDAAQAAAGDEADANAGCEVVFSYFANEIRHGGRMTPYSFVSTRSGLSENEIALLEWTAEDLGARVGDDVSLSYFVLSDQGLVEKTRTLRVAEVLPMDAAADPSRMLPLPGIGEEQYCADWEPGFPVDLAKIRKKDEVYWERWRGAPKAFVSLSRAREMWSNRYGNCTALRFSGMGLDGLSAALRERLFPESLGFSVDDAYGTRLAASGGGVDFGQLFLGLSMFLLFAPFALVWLLTGQAVRERAGETALLLGLGITVGRRQRLLVMEFGLVLVAGAALGGVGGIVYAKAVLWGLATVWRDAVGDMPLSFTVDPLTTIAGCVFVCAVGLLGIWRVIRRESEAWRRPALAGGMIHPAHHAAIKPERSDVGGDDAGGGGWRRVLRAARRHDARTFWLAGGCLSGGILVIVLQDQVWGFMLGGALLLLGCLLAYAGYLNVCPVADSYRGLLRGELFRHRRVGLLLAGLVGAGLFVVTGVSLNRPPTPDWRERTSGSGGYGLVCETALPLSFDPNAPEGRQALALKDSDGSAQAFFVSGQDDASCLNLNRVEQPRLIGIPPAAVSGRFSFSSSLAGVPAGWDALTVRLPSWSEDVVPAVADAEVVLWGLGKKLGDELRYTDEAGNEIRVKLVAALESSVFQGAVLVDESRLRRHFPTTAVRSFMLIETGAGGSPENDPTRLAHAKSEWRERLAGWGPQVQTAEERLSSYLLVARTYLSIFLLLGALGLLLATGVAAGVVARDLALRREETGLLLSLGFPARQVLRLLESSYRVSCMWGAGAGMLCGLVASGGNGGIVPVLSGVGVAGLLLLFLMAQIRFLSLRHLRDAKRFGRSPD